MSVYIIAQWMLYLLVNEPHHELKDDPELLNRVAEYWIGSADQYNDDPMRLAYYGWREATLLPDRTGKIGEQGYCQAHGKARRVCEAAGYDITTRKGGAYCLGLLMNMGKRRCGSPTRRDGWYMSGFCTKANQKAKKRDDAFRRKVAKFYATLELEKSNVENKPELANDKENSTMAEPGLADKIISGHDGLPGNTAKLDIGTDSVYVHTSWLNGNLARIDITLSRGEKTNGALLVGQGTVEDLALKKFDLARSWVEDSCKLASMLLDSGTPVYEITNHWLGRVGYPSGYCPQLRSIVPGPLHAAAKLIDENMERWKIQFGELN